MPRKSMPRRRRSKDMRRPNRSKHSAQRSRTTKSSRHRAYAQSVKTNFDILDHDVRYGMSSFFNSFSISDLRKRRRTTSEPLNTAALEVLRNPDLMNKIAQCVFNETGEPRDIINLAQVNKISHEQTKNLLLDLAEASNPICTSEDYEFATELKKWCSYDTFTNFCNNQFSINVEAEEFDLKDKDGFVERINNRDKLTFDDKASFLQENSFKAECFRVDQKTVRRMTIWERFISYVLPRLLPTLPTEQLREMTLNFYHNTLETVLPNDGVFVYPEVVHFFQQPYVVQTFIQILKAEQTLRLVTIANFLQDSKCAYGKFRFMMETRGATLSALQNDVPELRIPILRVRTMLGGISMERFTSVADMWCTILDKYSEFELHFIVNMDPDDFADNGISYVLTPFQKTIINYCNNLPDHNKFTILFQIIGVGILNHEQVLDLSPLIAIPKVQPQDLQMLGAWNTIRPPLSYYLGNRTPPNVLEQTL